MNKAVANPKETEIRRFKPYPVDVAEYEKAGERMHALASKIPGFISFKRYSSDDGDAFAIVKFESGQALGAWRNRPEHAAVQRRRAEFYDRYWVQVCKSVREYE